MKLKREKKKIYIEREEMGQVESIISWKSESLMAGKVCSARRVLRGTITTGSL